MDGQMGKQLHKHNTLPLLFGMVYHKNTAYERLANSNCMNFCKYYKAPPINIVAL